MTFEYPVLLGLLLVIPLIFAGCFWALKNTRRNTRLMVTADLWDRMLNKWDESRTWIRLGVLCVGATFLLLAALRPQYGTEYEATTASGQAVMLAFDTSLSMDAADVAPSRLEHAKRDAVALIEQLDGDRVGVIRFAGIAAVECPLTVDYMAVRLFVDDVRTRSLPIPGTNIAAAIEAAIDSFKRIPGRKTVIIYSDGEHFDGDLAKAAAKAKAEGIVVHTVGIGGTEGSTIPLSDEDASAGQFKVDSNGKPVNTRLNAVALKSVAATTGGQYIHATEQVPAAPQLMVL
ncbi:VWA domain-containing protein, partial [bacterium]|nr:VWA domain-containing protein [bacterium]